MTACEDEVFPIEDDHSVLSPNDLILATNTVMEKAEPEKLENSPNDENPQQNLEKVPTPTASTFGEQKEFQLKKVEWEAEKIELKEKLQAAMNEISNLKNNLKCLEQTIQNITTSLE